MPRYRRSGGGETAQRRDRFGRLVTIRPNSPVEVTKPATVEVRKTEITHCPEGEDDPTNPELVIVSPAREEVWRVDKIDCIFS